MCPHFKCSNSCWGLTNRLEVNDGEMETEVKTVVGAMEREVSEFVLCIIALRGEINFMSVVPCV